MSPDLNRRTTPISLCASERELGENAHVAVLTQSRQALFFAHAQLARAWLRAPELRAAQRNVATQPAAPATYRTEGHHWFDFGAGEKRPCFSRYGVDTLLL